jgi:DNA-binding XRE family transcriptional regulator
MDMQKACDRIRGKRNELRLSQEALADKLHISARAYNFKENNKVRFTLDEIMILLDLFGCKFEDIFLK